VEIEKKKRSVSFGLNLPSARYIWKNRIAKVILWTI